MNGLPTGLYQAGDSAVHRLDAGVKIVCLIILLVGVVNTSTLWGYAAWAVLTLLLIRAAGISPSSALGPAVRLRWFFAVIFIMNLCFYGPGRPWVSWWIFRPSYEGMMQGVNVVARVFLLLVMSNVLTVTTAPLAMTGAMERLLSPLRFVGVPTDLVAMILSVAIQFIPTLFEETDSIRKAQTARGARFDSPRLLEKAGAVIPLLVPIFLAAFKRADELSLAMEARGYRTDVRRAGKRYPPLRAADCAALALCAALAAAFVIIK